MSKEIIKNKFKNGMIPNENDFGELIDFAGESDAEVIQARGGLPLLKDRLDKTDSQLTHTANEQGKLLLGETSRYNSTFYDLSNTDGMVFQNIDGAVNNPWTIANNTITSVITTDESICWLPQKIQDGKLSFMWENPDTNATLTGRWAGFVVRGVDRKTSLLITIRYGADSNLVQILKNPGSRVFTSLISAELTTSDAMLQTNKPVQIECEFYGKYITVKVNGKTAIDKFTHDELLVPSGGYVGLAVSKFSPGMTFSNLTVQEKRYDIVPMKIEKVLCAGDSIVYGSGASNRDTTSWVSLLRNKLKEFNPLVEVTNVGVAGNSTTHVLTAQIIPNLTNGYQVAIVECGTNDGRIDPGRVTPLADAIANLTAIIKQLKSHNIIPIICTTTPYSPDIVPALSTSYDVTSYWYNVKLNGLIRHLCAKEKVRIVDLYSTFNNDFSLLSADKLHPNDAGYQLIYKTVYDTLVNRY